MQTYRILIVDDDHEVVRLMRSYLEQARYEVLIAHDGETALHQLRRERPDLVLLDWMLLDRAGDEITRNELIRQALGHTYDGVERTLDSHIRNLRRKIEQNPKKPHYLKSIYGVGYRLVAGDSL